MAPDPANLPILDAEQLLSRLGNSREVLAQMAQILTQSAPTWQTEIAAALEAQDGERLRRAAHQVKGAMLTFAAPRAASAAERLEKLAKSGQLEHADSGVAYLMTEIADVEMAVNGLLSNQSPNPSR